MTKRWRKQKARATLKFKDAVGLANLLIHLLIVLRDWLS